MNNNQLNILAFDCSTGPTSVVVAQESKIKASLREPHSSRQSQFLIPMIEECLAQSDLTYQQLDAIAVTTGPGSFTGIRIGLAAARALALAAQKPLYGISTLEMMACGACHKQNAALPILAALEAGRGEVYVQLFSSSLPLVSLGEPRAINLAVLLESLPLEAYTLCSNAANITEQSLSMSAIKQRMQFVPDAVWLAECALSRIQNKAPVVSVTPLYIRAPDARLPGTTH